MSSSLYRKIEELEIGAGAARQVIAAGAPTRTATVTPPESTR
jgi:hypothetical protein